MSLGLGLLGRKLDAAGRDPALTFLPPLYCPPEVIHFLCCLSPPTSIFGFLHLDFAMVRKEWQPRWVAISPGQCDVWEEVAHVPQKHWAWFESFLVSNCLLLSLGGFRSGGLGLLQAPHMLWFEMTAASIWFQLPILCRTSPRKIFLLCWEVMKKQ